MTTVDGVETREDARRVPFELRMACSEEGVDVTAIPSFDAGASDLEVLPRHVNELSARYLLDPSWALLGLG
jgi:hypothetical protein